MVAYGRLKTIENFKQSSLKLVAYERWSPTRGSIYSDFGILEKWSLMRGGRLREVVAKGGSTVSYRSLYPIYSINLYCIFGVKLHHKGASDLIVLLPGE